VGEGQPIAPESDRNPWRLPRAQRVRPGLLAEMTSGARPSVAGGGRRGTDSEKELNGPWAASLAGPNRLPSA
jgi:hypothetical protein